MKLKFKTAAREIDHARTGAAAKASREGAGVSQKALADEMRISDSYLCDLEAGRRGWTQERCNDFNAALIRAFNAKCATQRVPA